jgi:hypothetical protein
MDHYHVGMDDLVNEPMWVDYIRISEEHSQAVNARRKIEQDLLTNFSDDTLRLWDEAHRAEEKCYEQVKAAERAVWAKLHNS